MNLDEKVYKKLLQVPKGKITTYGELAKAVGLQNGQRAIGKIMNKNPYPVIEPPTEEPVTEEVKSHLFAIRTTGGQEKVVMRILETRARSNKNSHSICFVGE